MNTLPADKQQAAIQALIEGNSIRSTERIVGIHRDTIMRLLVRTGEGCAAFLDKQIKDVRAEKVQVDEIWTYVFKKQARISIDESMAGIGDQYVFVGIDADTKLVICHLVGKRDAASAYQQRTVLSLTRKLGHYPGAGSRKFSGVPTLSPCRLPSTRARAKS